MIRRLTGTELEGLAWIDQLQGPAFHWNLEQLRGLEPSHEFWGLMDQDQIKAFVGIIRLPQAWEIPIVATHPRFARQGCMRTLLLEVLEARRQDAEIWLEVHEGNGPARALYEALGFEQVGRRPRYYTDGAAALLLTLKAGSGAI